MATFERELAAAVEHEDLDAIVAALAKRGSGDVAVGADPGTAKVGDIVLAARLIRSHISSQARAPVGWVKRLLTPTRFQRESTGAGAAIRCVSSRIRRRRSNGCNVTPTARTGPCANMPVRARAASSISTLTEVYPVLKDWSKHKSENVRRAVVIAAMEAAKANQPKRGAKLLKLIDPLMDDDSRYVRVNLGQFAISLALLKNYPELTLKFLQKHAKRKNEFARWNVAMVWSAVGGRTYAEEGMEFLTDLAADERRFVWRAVASAAAKLGRAKPEVVKPWLKKWQRRSARASEPNVRRT